MGTDTKSPLYGNEDGPFPRILSIPAATNTLYDGGHVGGTDASGNCAEDMLCVKVWGIIQSRTDNRTTAGGNPNPGYGTAGVIDVPIQPGAALFESDGTLTASTVGQYAYLKSGATTSALAIASLSDGGGTRPLLGYQVPFTALAGTPDYDTASSSAKVAIQLGQARPDALSGGSSASAYKARGVATNLAALTFTGGTMTANANGALAAQDGLTIAVNDVLVFPAGTITTGVVSAANSGPWQFTSIGGAGKFTAIRPDWWVNGQGLVPGVAIRVAAGTVFGGTDWQSFADEGLVIGTDDPALYPEKVTQQVTLVAGTKTISNVPIFATARIGLTVALAGGTPDATTTGYDFRLVAGRVAGGIGTASAIIDAQATKGAAKVAGDVSVINVTLING